MIFSLLQHLRLSVDGGRNSGAFLGQFKVPLKVQLSYSNTLRMQNCLVFVITKH